MVGKCSYWCPDEKCGKAVYYCGSRYEIKYQCQRCNKVFTKDELRAVQNVR